MDLWTSRPTRYQLDDIERRAGVRVRVVPVHLVFARRDDEEVCLRYMVAGAYEPRARVQARLDAYIHEVYGGDVPRGVLID